MTEISVKLKEKLAKRIYKLSEDTNKDSSFHINKALENYLEELGEMDTALDRLNDKHDAVLSSGQMRKSLGL